MSVEAIIQSLKSEALAKDQGVLEEVKEMIRRFVVLESEAHYDAITLYVAYTYLQAELEIYPRLVITSPDKQCGKTLLLTVIQFLVENANRTSNISEAALFRTIEQSEEIVLFIDEYDATFGKNANKEKAEALRQIFNEGFLENGNVTRCEKVGNKIEVKQFGVACPVVLAGIGEKNLADTIRDRSILIRMRRITAGEGVSLDRFRLRKAGLEFAPVRDRLRNALKPRAKEVLDLRDAVVFPKELSPRQEDVWEGLFAVALLFGEEWLDRASASAVALSDKSLEPTSQRYQVETLSLCRDVFEEITEDRISASDLVSKINNLEHSPYKDSPFSMNARKLADHLQEFQVHSVSNGKTRNYFKASFEKAWKAYLLEPVISVKPVSEEENPYTFDGFDAS
jgi:hypothetical protein